MARRAEAKPKGDFGPIYRGREGQWAWLLHRVTGVGIILFLFAHVVDTAVIGWGPAAYNRVLWEGLKGKPLGFASSAKQ